MLGAWALGIDYTGIDTNVNMALHDSMIEMLNSKTPAIFEESNYRCCGKRCPPPKYLAH